MDPILIYGFPSGSSMGLIAVLEWLGKPYRLCRVDMFGEMRVAGYRRLNARVETPVLVTDRGEPLSETMAIAAWIEARDSERKVSFDAMTREADRLHQLTAFLNTGFTAAFGPLWAALELEDASPVLREALRDWGRGAVEERHDRLEEMIADMTFLAGDRPTIADGVLIGVARWLDLHLGAGRERWPKLSALRARIESDPAVVYAMALESGGDAEGSGACLGHVALEEVIDRFGR